MFEAMPNAFTRDEIRTSLCSDANARIKVHDCMQEKEKDFTASISSEEMDEKIKMYKTCVNSVIPMDTKQ